MGKFAELTERQRLSSALHSARTADSCLSKRKKMLSANQSALAEDDILTVDLSFERQLILACV